MSYVIAQQSSNAASVSSGSDRRKLLFYSSMATVALAFVVVVLGAFTRLSDAGLGCPDWPGCYGHLMWPTSSEEVALAQARFPEAPVEHDKTWPEMVHRYFAGMLGLVILGIVVISWRWRNSSPPIPQKLPRFLLFLVIVQAAFGMWTVTLKLWPQVVTAHLLGGFATLSLLWLLAQRLSTWRWQYNAACSRGARLLAMLALVVVVAQIALGGWTSSNYAALACPDLPTCHGVWWPHADFSQGFNIFQQVGPNYLGGLLDNHARTAIHLVHRIGAIVVAVIVSILAWRLWSAKSRQSRAMAAILMMVLLLQIGLGLSNVYWVLPLPVAVAHNAGGAVLLLVLVTVNHRLRTARIPQGENK